MMSGRRVVSVLVATLVIPLLAEAAPSDVKHACVVQHDDSQRFRRERKLKDARADLKACARNVCPAVIRQDCLPWLEQVEASLPSIVIGAKRGSIAVTDVQVSIDGAVVQTSLDGTSIDIDPGEHKLRFERPGSPPDEQTLVIREGEKNRLVAVQFEGPRAAAAVVAAAPSEPAAAGARPIPTGVYVLGGVGVVGMAVFAGLGAVGKSDESSLASSCAPDCAASSVDAVHDKYLGADIALGVGVAALAGGALWFLLRPSRQEAPSQSGFVLAPGRSGGTLGWEGRF
jgi:hypothetical protein